MNMFSVTMDFMNFSIDILPTFCLLVWNSFSFEHSFISCVKSVHIRSYSGPNTEEYVPE